MSLVHLGFFLVFRKQMYGSKKERPRTLARPFHIQGIRLYPIVTVWLWPFTVTV